MNYFEDIRLMCESSGFDLIGASATVSPYDLNSEYDIKLIKRNNIKIQPKAKKRSGAMISVKSIKYSGKYTTVTWNDNTKTRVSCGENEQQSRYSAFCSALAIKIFGTNSQVKKIVETKDEQIEIDKQNKIREEKDRAAKVRKARKDRLWVKKRAKEIALEQRAQKMAQQLLSE